MTIFKNQIGVPVESVMELSSWLASSNAHGIFMVAQDKTDKTKVNVMIINGDDDFLAAAGLCAMDFIDFVASRINRDEGPSNRADRRRSRRARQ